MDFDGLFSLNSTAWVWSEITCKPQTILDISIYYNDGQVIHTEIRVNEGNPSNKDIYFAVAKYFKGNLMWKVL